MQQSPLEFSRYWAELMAAVDQASDTGLLVLTRLWTDLGPHKSDPRFAPYFDEYRGRLESLVTEGNLRDIGFDDLRQLRTIVTSLGLTEKLSPVIRAEAKLWAYIGEPAKAVDVVAQLTGESPAVELPDENAGGGSEQILMESAINRTAESAPQTAKILSEILAEWQTETSALAHDSAWCLLVQIGPHLGGGWGRLLKLKGDVDLLSRKKIAGDGGPSDQVTFAHQLRSPDDPAIAGVYDSLSGVRTALADLGLAKSARDKSWAVRLEFEGGNHQYHGDSLGLAAGLLTYAGLLKDEFLRHERKLSGEVGFTGVVDSNGQLTPVNNSTLKDKVTRAFFSHLKYLVVPKENEAVAREVIANLTAQYPRRRLHLVAAETIGEVVEDRNLVRPEKLCPAAYIAKGALKYSRATKVQVPLLVVLVGLLGFVIADQFLPECSKPWGDCNPAFVQASGHSIHVFNSDSVLLWRREFECRIDTGAWTRVLTDLDGNGGQEVMMIAQNDELCKETHHLLAYTSDGDLLWNVDCRIKGEYPGDEGDNVWYSGSNLYHFNVNQAPIIVSGLCQSNPSRMLLKGRDKDGILKFSYVNAGSSSPYIPLDVDNNGTEELLFAGTNRRMFAAAVFALSVETTYGVSPPYSDPEYDLSKVRRGNQLRYVICPATKLCFLPSSEAPYPNLIGLFPTENGDSTSAFYIITGEGRREAELYYYFDRHCRVVRADLGDNFKSDYSRMIGVDLQEFNSNLLCDSIVRDVSYWTDSGWVTEGALREAKQ